MAVYALLDSSVVYLPYFFSTELVVWCLVCGGYLKWCVRISMIFWLAVLVCNHQVSFCPGRKIARMYLHAPRSSSSTRYGSSSSSDQLSHQAARDEERRDQAVELDLEAQNASTAVRCTHLGGL
ncbi:hypothetical protein BD311DRAFT_68559 [Dichomitus squalens]|uniref:Uncharacterized protein n=1 Tax=Dichomitus squalens TaxID=114155 RepID=A0A4Q9MBF3_9APHY|nr:hypothetical protein BD311DRAFT_68559 [Dichomitus squalens]